jgi:hypothetical protein
MLATTELQAHVYSVLTGASIAGGRVYDEPPQEATFPYVTIGEVIPAPFRTHSRDGEELLHAVHIWSRYRGFREGQVIAEAIKPLLDHIDFETTNFHGVALREQTLWLRDPDGITRHGALNFRFWLLAKN